MKKFIAAFDPLHYCESTTRYAIFLAKTCHAHLVGVSLEDFTRRSYGMLELTHYEGADIDGYVHQLDEKDDEMRKENIHRFQDACKEAGIKFSVHRDRNVALQELLQESIYADLLIISATETMTRYQEPAPPRFIRELLNEVQCPVVLVPANYYTVSKIILLYDGEPSSVYAARLFSYLFENIKELETIVLTVNKSEESVLLPNSRLVREFVLQHYPKAEAIILKGDAGQEITAYLKREKSYPLVVMGAYQRSKFSRAFRPSMADHLLQHVEVPLFIAHNKS